MWKQFMSDWTPLISMVVAKSNVTPIIQALIVAAVTATATGYVSIKVIEREVSRLVSEIIRLDANDREMRLKLEDVQLRQARVISQADTIHDMQNKRMDRLEMRR